jgi:hypothetical protein
MSKIEAVSPRGIPVGLGWRLAVRKRAPSHACCCSEFLGPYGTPIESTRLFLQTANR